MWRLSDQPFRAEALSHSYGEESLAAVQVLQQVVDAIWKVHGEEMAIEAGTEPHRWPLDELLREIADDPGEDDIPF